MDLDSDSGQTTVEWLALMAMIVALVGVLVATVPDVGHTIVDTFEKIIRAVTP
jgi:Flp pilus assembly pilin Flp